MNAGPGSPASPWAPPAVGDILWCHFPYVPDPNPGPKPRPALVVQVTVRVDGVAVAVAYGTSQRVERLVAGEFSICAQHHPVAYALAGLSFDTKFNFKQIVELPWTAAFFKVPPRAPQGQQPKLGTLHPSLMQAAQVAYRAAKRVTARY